MVGYLRKREEKKRVKRTLEDCTSGEDGRKMKGGGDGKTEEAQERERERRTAKKGRIDKASWNFFNPGPGLCAAKKLRQ